MYKFERARVLLFAKEPQLGQVKTRMQPALTVEESMQLHSALTAYVAQQLNDWQLCPVQLQYKKLSDGEPKFLSDLCTRFNFELHAQVVGDLGQKMAAAAKKNIEQGFAVILLGADCPFFEVELLVSLIECLQDDCDAALIPAHDGGYVAMALRSFNQEIFVGVDWGSEKVLAQTLAKMDRLQWRYQCLPALADIDRPEDLGLLASHANPQLQAFSVRLP